MIWICVEQLDNDLSTSILSIDDSDGLRRLSLSIGDTKSKKLTITTCKASHEFQNFTIVEGNWYHIAIVHQKPRLTASIVSLFVNGQLKETAKCGYLGHPGTSSQVTTYFGSRNTIRNSIFLLGPTYMFEENTLEAAVIAVVFEIGFEYTGNWQGSWSKYLVGNELLRSKAVQIADDEAKSPLGQLNFVLQQGKPLIPLTLNVPEDKVLFSLSASNLIDPQSKARKTNEPLKFFNGAFQKNDEISKSAIICLYGSVLHVCPNRFVDSLWSLGGASIILKLVEDSQVS